MKKLLTLIAAGVLLAGVPMSSVADSSQAAAKPLQAESIIMDRADLLTDKEEKWLAKEAERIKLDHGIAIAFESMNATPKEGMEKYTTKRANDLGLGTEADDNGLFFAVAIDERDFYVATGDGLHKVVTNEELDAIVANELVPSYKDELFAQGVIDTSNKVGELYQSGGGTLPYEYVEKAEASGFSMRDSGSKSSGFFSFDPIIAIVLGIFGFIGGLIAFDGIKRKLSKKRYSKKIDPMASRAATKMKEDVREAEYANLVDRYQRHQYLKKHAGASLSEKEMLYFENEVNYRLFGISNVETALSVNLALEKEAQRREDELISRDVWNRIDRRQRMFYMDAPSRFERERYMRSIGFTSMQSNALGAGMFSAHLRDNSSINEVKERDSSSSSGYTRDSSGSSSSFGGGSFSSGGGSGGKF